MPLLLRAKAANFLRTEIEERLDKEPVTFISALPILDHARDARFQRVFQQSLFLGLKLQTSPKDDR